MFPSFSLIWMFFFHPTISRTFLHELTCSNTYIRQFKPTGDVSFSVLFSDPPFLGTAYLDMRTLRNLIKTNWTSLDELLLATFSGSCVNKKIKLKTFVKTKNVFYEFSWVKYFSWIVWWIDLQRQNKHTRYYFEFSEKQCFGIFNLKAS